MNKYSNISLLIATLMLMSACSKSADKSRSTSVAASEPITAAAAAKICQNIAKPQFPAADIPDSATAKKLENCSSYNLYYGVDSKLDYSQARQCAFVEMKAGAGAPSNSFSGKVALMTIYATANGAKLNRQLALQLACEQLN